MTFELLPLGYIVLPVTILLAVFRRSWLLAWAIACMVLPAASVVDVSRGDYLFGVQPGYVAAAAFLVFALVLLIKDTRFRDSHLSRTYFPLLLFAGIAVLSAVVLPRVFSGDVLVYPPREGLLI